MVTFSIPFITYLLIPLQASQKTQEKVAIIDAKPNRVSKAEILDVIAELRCIIKEALEALS